MVVDALDDVGASLESLTPKRESLEDYFSRLISDFDREHPRGPADDEADVVAAPAAAEGGEAR
jgi:hypothetical protein